MKTAKATAFALLAAALAVSPLAGGPRFEVKLRVYEGGREGSLTPPVFVTSSYIQPTVAKSLQTEIDAEKEAAGVKRVFNLKDLNLLTEAVLLLSGEEAGLPADQARHFFRLNGNAFAVNVKLVEDKSKRGFLVVFDEVVGEKTVNILTTEVQLVGGHTAVLGFEDRQGKPYFCSFHLSGPAAGIPVPPAPSSPPPPPSPTAPPRPPDIGKKIEQFEKGAVKASKSVKPPRLVESVMPVYPEEARQQGLEGMVIVNARMDTRGNVSDAMILKSTNEAFNAAALAAVKAWKYEPMVINGKPQDVVFTVTIRFTLKADKKAPEPPPPPPAPLD
jgi:TonB family protein